MLLVVTAAVEVRPNDMPRTLWQFAYRCGLLRSRHCHSQKMRRYWTVKLRLSVWQLMHFRSAAFMTDLVNLTERKQAFSPAMLYSS